MCVQLRLLMSCCHGITLVTFLHSFLGWLVINLYDVLLASNSFAAVKAAIADQWKGNS